MQSRDGHVEISNEIQRVAFDRNPNGVWEITTYVRNGSRWDALFDARRPIVEGSCFNLQPSSCEIVENSPSRKAILLKGTRQNPDYPWDARVELEAGSPLIKFAITCRLPSDLKIDNPQPTVALWMNQTTATLTVDQGPVSQTGDAYNVAFCFGFPAAYLWDNNREAVVFFNMTPMTWFSPWGVHRFINIQIKSQTRNGQTGLGMHPRKLSGNKITSGPMIIEYYLYSARREGKPAKFEALDMMIRVCAPLHPANAEFPKDTLEGGEVTWERFAGRTIHDLMLKNVTCAVVKKPWKDEPLELVKHRDEMIAHPDLMKSDPAVLPSAWNFSTVNHHLAPWMLYARLHPTTGTLEFARIKKDAVPRFYDPPSRMIRSFLPQSPPVNPMEISWQSLVFYQEMLQINETLADEDFNPAVAGRMLMANEGLIGYARNVGYVFSTYFNPLSRQPLPYYENPGLGAVREPWTVGSYSFVMARSYGMSGNRQFLDEARVSLDTFLHKMRYSESNKYYTRSYSDPMDMPPSDLTGNAYGAVAAYNLYELEGNPQWLRVSRDFLNTLLRMTFWHEDRTDAVNRELGHAGLFYAYVGAACATPWETTEAHLCIAWLLDRDVSNPLNPLLLKLSNLNRINSFHFYPATYGPAVRALNPDLRRDVGQYFPVEPLYQLESMGGSTGKEGTALYMAGNSIWNWWMYEALAAASDRSIMALNTSTLDHCEEAITGADRPLIVFNPTEGRRAFSLRLKGLESGNYTLTIMGAPNRQGVTKAYTASQLTAGIPMELDSLDYARAELRRQDDGATLARIKAARTARYRLAYAYARLQEWARDKGKSLKTGGLQNDYQSAMQAFIQRDYKVAVRKAENIIQETAH
ncbi:MAG: hypothetical protein WCK47_08190 [bacterium]